MTNVLLIKTEDFRDFGFEQSYPVLFWRSAGNADPSVVDMIVVNSDTHEEPDPSLVSNPTLFSNTRTFIHFGGEDSYNINRLTAESLWKNQFLNDSVFQELYREQGKQPLIDSVLPFSKGSAERSTPWDREICELLKQLAATLAAPPLRPESKKLPDSAAEPLPLYHLPENIAQDFISSWEAAHVFYSTFHPLRQWSALAFPIYLDYRGCADQKTGDRPAFWEEARQKWRGNLVELSGNLPILPIIESLNEHFISDCAQLMDNVKIAARLLQNFCDESTFTSDAPVDCLLGIPKLTGIVELHCTIQK